MIGFIEFIEEIQFVEDGAIPDTAVTVDGEPVTNGGEIVTNGEV